MVCELHLDPFVLDLMKTECDVNGIDAGGDPIQEESKWQLEILLLGCSFFVVFFLAVHIGFYYWNTLCKAVFLLLKSVKRKTRIMRTCAERNENTAG